MGFNPERTKLNIEQGRNYLHSEEFDKNAHTKIDALIDQSKTAETAGPGAQKRLLRMGCAELKQDGIEGIYKRILLCKLHGASDIQIGIAMKIHPEKVRTLEKEAVKCVMDKLGSRRIAPVIGQV